MALACSRADQVDLDAPVSQCVLVRSGNASWAFWHVRTWRTWRFRTVYHIHYGGSWRARYADEVAPLLTGPAAVAAMPAVRSG